MPEYLAIPEELFRHLTTEGIEKVPLTIDKQLYMVVGQDLIRKLYIKDDESEEFKASYGDWVRNLRAGKVDLKPTAYEGVYVVELVFRPNKKNIKSAINKHPKANSTEDKYVNFCGTRNLKSLVDGAKRDIERIAPKIAKLQSELVKAIKYLNDRQRALESVVSGQMLDDNLRLEFQKLKSHPDIEKIVITKQSLMVYTKPISIEHKGKTYAIGKFKITVYSNGAKGGVIMENQTKLIMQDGGYYMHHPHIRSKTKKAAPFVCLGNIQEIVAQLIGERQYPALISICIEYLKSYNDDDGLAEPPESWGEGE